MEYEHPVELPLMKWLMAKAVRKGQLAAITFELTPVCNFNCRMCYVRMTLGQVAAWPRPMMKLDDWLRIAEECRQMGTLSILLTGGEPLLWPEFWPLYEKLHHMGFLVSVNTNGSLIDEVVLERWKKMPPTRVNITLYGASDETYYNLCQVHGQFRKVAENIRALRKIGVSVKINCSLTPQNARDLEAMVRFSEEEKLILSVTPYMFPPIRRDETMVGQNERFTPEEAAFYFLKRYRLQHTEERYQSFLQKLREEKGIPQGLLEGCTWEVDDCIKCRAGRASAWITWDGWFTACGMMPEPKVDLRADSFGEAWETLKEKTSMIRTSSACSHCKGSEICHSCAAMAMAETGTTEQVPVYLCRMVQAMYEIAQSNIQI